MPLSDLSFDVPAELIAQFPLAQRSASRLLVLDGSTAEVTHTQFGSLVDWLRADDLLVMNDTEVIPARLFGHKETGGRLEILIERVLDRERVLTRIRASKSPPAGSKVSLGDDPDAPLASGIVEGRQDEFFILSFIDDERSAAEIISDAGYVPLPPYIDRAAGVEDQERYQTVYARHPGAVAAPTAGLHFDHSLLSALTEMGVETAYVTLHVGAGTFQPIRNGDVDAHVMHKELVDVSAETVRKVEHARARGGRVIAVGTTSVRSLESAAQGGTLQAFHGETQLFIRPGDPFKVVDGMITNFHLPESTLMLLVAAFAGQRQIMQAYAAAIEQRYRFFSYGDAMLLWPNRQGWQQQ